MYRYFLKLSFKGTNFHGWQSQKNAKTIQDEINKVLSLKLAEDINATGAGRTDTGVHAKLFYAHFDSIKSDLHINKNIIKDINSFLHPDVALSEIIQVKADAHARFSASERTYKYYIHQKKNPFICEFSYYYPYYLDIELMNKASEVLMAATNFKSFCKSHSDNKSFECKLTECEWSQADDNIVFKISADRFLRNMVRAIVGTMIDIGRKKYGIEELHRIVASKDRKLAGKSVPANGLFLTGIKYPLEIFV
ncbi:MAG: tRNA pseudouridine(38-40) synthase TruA [Marinilabiliales bacterium]